MTAGYLRAFRQAVAELEDAKKAKEAKKAPASNDLNSLNSLISQPLPHHKPLERAFLDLERRCPKYVEVPRWQHCVEDAKRFLARWAERALALGWTEADLFALHTPPANPHLDDFGGPND